MDDQGQKWTEHEDEAIKSIGVVLGNMSLDVYETSSWAEPSLARDLPAGRSPEECKRRYHRWFLWTGVQKDQLLRTAKFMRDEATLCVHDADAWFKKIVTGKLPNGKDAAACFRWFKEEVVVKDPRVSDMFPKLNAVQASLEEHDPEKMKADDVVTDQHVLDMARCVHRYGDKVSVLGSWYGASLRGEYPEGLNVYDAFERFKCIEKAYTKSALQIHKYWVQFRNEPGEMLSAFWNRKADIYTSEGFLTKEDLPVLYKLCTVIDDRSTWKVLSPWKAYSALRKNALSTSDAVAYLDQLNFMEEGGSSCKRSRRE